MCWHGMGDLPPHFQRPLLTLHPVLPCKAVPYMRSTLGLAWISLCPCSAAAFPTSKYSFPVPTSGRHYQLPSPSPRHLAYRSYHGRHHCIKVDYLNDCLDTKL